jgi:predicted dinucleotide-binding enzyme
MKIGIIGSGEVGQALAKGFLKYGYTVMIGTNNKAKAGDLKTKIGGSLQVGSFEETAKFGELVVVAVKGTAAEAALRSAGAENLKDKTVIDSMNPIAEAPPVNGVLSYFTSPNESLMERLQKRFPQARFVKAFNSIGSPFMVNPDFDGTKPTMFICGNEASAKKDVAKIVQQFGFEVEDMGAVEAARPIEALCILWCLPGFLRNEWSHAFKLLKKQPVAVSS